MKKDLANLNCLAPLLDPLGETKRSDDFKRSINPKAIKNFLHTNDVMPEWPPENPFENSKRCRVLNESELQENDWIRLYLELAVAMTNRHHTNDMSYLKILKVAIDTAITQDVAIKVAIFYIRYKDSCQARVGKDVDRVAIIRRGFIEEMGYFRLMGQNLSSEIIPKKGKKRLFFGLRLKQRLLLKACKYNGVGLSSKKRSAQLSPSPRQPKACKYDGVDLSGKNAECATSS